MAKSKKSYYSIRSFLSYIATFKTRFVLIVCLFFISSVTLAVIPLFIGQFVAALAANPLNTNTVYFYASILIACSVSHEIIWRGAEFAFMKVLNPKGLAYENIVFQAVIEKEYPYFIGKFTGKISSYVSSLGKEFYSFLNIICYSYIDQIVKLPMLTFIMFSVHPLTGFIFLGSVATMFLVGRITIKRAAQAEMYATNIGSTMNGYVIDIISNFVSVKAFKKEAIETEIVVKQREEVIAASNTSFFWNLVFWGSLSIIVRWVVWPATILLNVHLYISGQINLAQITTFMSAIVIFSDYIWGTIWNVSQFNLKLAGMEEAYDYLFGKKDIVKQYLTTKKTKSAAVPAFYKQLALHKISFAYPDRADKKVLQDISLAIKKNEKIGVVGASGSGKTTLIKLLLGYYELSKDSMLVDGVAIDNRDLVELISYVPQDTALFHRSVKDNIAYGASGEVGDEAIITAARRAHAHEFISETKEGYDTLVGERGIKLSMGQRQRIAIARAFLDNKPLLILDEATSALDSESEVLVQQALEDLWSDKTVIAIAHRLSTLRHMDRIVVMDAGRIVEQGSHKELLAKQGKYFELWQHQSGGMIVEE